MRNLLHNSSCHLRVKVIGYIISLGPLYIVKFFKVSSTFRIYSSKLHGAMDAHKESNVTLPYFFSWQPSIVGRYVGIIHLIVIEQPKI